MKKIQPRRPPTQDNLYDFFISRARSNLHVALCFSPVNRIKNIEILYFDLNLNFLRSAKSFGLVL